MSQKSEEIIIKDSTIFFRVPWCSFSSYITTAFLNNKILNSNQYAYILARTNMPGWWILFISQSAWLVSQKQHFGHWTWVINRLSFNITDADLDSNIVSLLFPLLHVCGMKQKWEQMSWRRIWKLRNDRECPKNIWKLHNKEQSHFLYIYFIDCAVIFQVTKAICQKL